MSLPSPHSAAASPEMWRSQPASHAHLSFCPPLLGIEATAHKLTWPAVPPCWKQEVENLLRDWLLPFRSRCASHSKPYRQGCNELVQRQFSGGRRTHGPHVLRVLSQACQDRPGCTLLRRGLAAHHNQKGAIAGLCRAAACVAAGRCSRLGAGAYDRHSCRSMHHATGSHLSTGALEQMVLE